MVYHKVHLKLDRTKLLKLAKGEKVRLTHGHLHHGPHQMHLTATQMKRLGKAKMEGKGAMLQMSKTQLRHNKMHGSGMFTDLLKSGASALLKSGVVQKGLSSALQKGTDWAKSKGINSGLVDSVHGLATKGIDAGLNKLNTKLTGGDLSGIPVIGPILHGLFGLGLSKAKAIAVLKRGRRAHKAKGGKLMAHVRIEARKELAKKKPVKRRPVKRRAVKRTKKGGSFML
jgi:hypothetical protein